MIRIFIGRWRYPLLWFVLILSIGMVSRRWVGPEVSAILRMTVSLVTLWLVVLLLQRGEEARVVLESILLGNQKVREQIDEDLSRRATLLETRAEEIALLLAADTARRASSVETKLAVITNKLDENTSLTVASADASHQAEVAAHDAHTKVQDTTVLAGQILEVLKKNGS